MQKSSTSRRGTGFRARGDHESPYSVWLSPSGDSARAELWTTADAESPHAVDSATVRQYFENDIQRSRPVLAGLLLIWSVAVIRALTGRHDLSRQLSPSLRLVVAIAGDPADLHPDVLDRTSTLVRAGALSDARALVGRLPDARTINRTAAVDLVERMRVAGARRQQ